MNRISKINVNFNELFYLEKLFKKNFILKKEKMKNIHLRLMAYTNSFKAVENGVRIR